MISVCFQTVMIYTLSFMLIPPGYVYDVTGDFDNTFYLSSASGLLGGLLGFGVLIIQHRKKFRHTSKVSLPIQMGCELVDVSKL